MKRGLRGSPAARAVVAGVFVLAIACGLVWVAKTASPRDSAFREKLAESLLQLALIVVVGALLGGFVKAAFDWVTRQRVRQREHAERQLDLFRRVRGMHVAVENSRTLMRAHRQTPDRGASTYHEQSRRLMELRPEMQEVSQELKAGSELFVDQATIVEGLEGIIAYLKEGEEEYIGKNAAVEAASSSGKTILDVVAQCEMHWVKDFMDQGTRYRQQYDENLDKSKGAMRSQIYRGETGVERELLALVRERPGITKAELRDAAGLSSAGVAQNLRRMLDRGEVREEALPGGATGYRIAGDRTAPSASGREGEIG